MMEAGQIFGRLTLVEKTRVYPKSRPKIAWTCVCICGNNVVIQADNLRSGNSTSCGCYQKDEVRAKRWLHGGTYTTEYRSWTHMKERCYNPRNNAFPNYGARGIRVCEQWKESFEQFFRDVGPKPSLNYSLDRIDNNGNYEPKNCRWATKQEQQRNKRNNRTLTVEGRTLPLMEWAKQKGLLKTTIYERLHRGWSDERAVSPLRRSK